MKRTLTLTLALLLLSGISAPLLADTRYVSDQLEITLRKGKDTRQKILAMLPSGTPLEILKVDRDAGYARVRTPRGKEGWVLTRFLMKEPAAREQLALLKKRLAAVELENRRQQTRHQEIEQNKNALQQAHNRLEEENRKLSRQLADIKRTASSALAIDTENKTLKTRIVETERDLQALRQENEVLRDRTARDWFIVGALVVLGSMLFGIVLTRIRWRRKSSWDTL